MRFFIITAAYRSGSFCPYIVDTPGSEFRENSHATGPRSPNGRPQGSDPPWGGTPRGPGRRGPSGRCAGAASFPGGARLYPGAAYPGAGAEGVPGGGSGLCRGGVLAGAEGGVPGGSSGLCLDGVLAGAEGRAFSPGRRAKTFFKKALRACIRKREGLVCEDWWIRLSFRRFFGGFSRCYFRRKE